MTMIDQPKTPSAAKPAKTPKPAKQAVAVHQPQAAPANAMTVVERAIEKGLTGQDLKEMMDLQERWEASQNRKAFDVALFAATAEIPTIVKNRLVAFEAKSGGKDTSYRHEDLAQVIDTIRPHLFKHGLGHRFDTKQDMANGGLITVTCIIYGHGHREETSLSSGPDQNGSGMNNLQRIASATTYLERYTLKAALGLASKYDDDGRASGGDNSTITALQLKQLEDLAKEVGADVTRACKALGIGSLHELPASRFDKAIASLEAKRVPL
jgi:hypothetical protein